jgi:60 kDa SS-A/Ro ribonucleoprotein
VAGWYQSKTPDHLAYQLIKYRQREGYAHRDLLRLAHPKPQDAGHKALYAALTGKIAPAEGRVYPDLPKLWEGYRKALDAPDAKTSAQLVADYGLPWEALRTEHLTERVVWEALLVQGLSMTALIRNLGRISPMLDPMGSLTRQVCDQLCDQDRLRRARIHPLSLLIALKTYSQGHGFRGGGSWPVLSMVVDALDEAFYLSFAHVEPSNKRTFLSLDVSSSMTQRLMNTNVSAAEGSCAMAMVTARTEPQWLIGAFATEFAIVGMSPRERLDDLVKRTQRMGFGGTDCALPMLVAAQEGWEIDTFITYTDSETWAGRIHPAQALQQYRNKMNRPNAKLVVVGMTSTGFSIADPNDAGSLDVVGFDTATPSVITNFASA